VDVELPCSHRTYVHHTAGRINGRIVWVCTACCYQGFWSRQWAPFCPYPCPKCRKPVIERVLCPQCAKRAREMR
jgi:hypothetical protein